MDEEKILFLLEKINDKIGNLNETVNDLKLEMHTAKEEIRKLGTKIDSEITNKIRALFDDRQVMHEKVDEINEKIDRIQIDVNNITIKTLYHDNKIVELGKKLGNR